MPFFLFCFGTVFSGCLERFADFRSGPEGGGQRKMRAAFESIASKTAPRCFLDPPKSSTRAPRPPPKEPQYCNLRSIWLVEAILYRNLQGLVALAGLKLSHSFFGGSVALHALWLLPLMVLEVVELVLVELAGSELVRARLALVCLQVTRVKPLCTAGLANQFRPLRRKVILSFRLRPVLQLIFCLTLAASKLRPTVPAHQAGQLSSLHGEQHVLVEFEAAELLQALSFLHGEQHVLVESEASELLQALLALVLVVLPRRVSSLCAARAHEVSAQPPMGSYHLPRPRASIQHLFAGRAPVAIGGQTILPSNVALGTTPAFCNCCCSSTRFC